MSSLEFMATVLRKVIAWQLSKYAEKGYSQEHYHPKVEESYVVMQGNAKLDVDRKIDQT